MIITISNPPGLLKHILRHNVGIYKIPPPNNTYQMLYKNCVDLWQPVWSLVRPSLGRTIAGPRL